MGRNIFRAKRRPIGEPGLRVLRALYAEAKDDVLDITKLSALVQRDRGTVLSHLHRLFMDGLVEYGRMNGRVSAKITEAGIRKAQKMEAK